MDPENPPSIILPIAIMIDGVAINPTGTYRVTVNSFLADGGDGFFVLRDGTDRLGGAVDTDAFEAYFQTHSPVPPGPQNRIKMCIRDSCGTGGDGADRAALAGAGSHENGE